METNATQDLNQAQQTSSAEKYREKFIREGLGGNPFTQGFDNQVFNYLNPQSANTLHQPKPLHTQQSADLLKKANELAQRREALK